MKLIGSGTSRKVYYNGVKNIILDGIEVSIPTCKKVAASSKFDNYHTGDIFGIQQNNNESDSRFDKHRVFLKIGHSEYITNKIGIFTNIFDGDCNEIIANMVTPFITNDDNQYISDDMMNIILKTEHIHNITFNDLYESLIELEIYKTDSTYNISKQSKTILTKHHLGVELSKFIIDDCISGYDLVDSNWGIFTHPITGKMSPIILDYGMSKLTLDKMKDVKYKMKTGH